jgi:hypothetical protein
MGDAKNRIFGSDIFYVVDVNYVTSRKRSEFRLFGGARGSKGVKMEGKKATALEDVTRQQLVKAQQTEKSWCVL